MTVDGPTERTKELSDEMLAAVDIIERLRAETEELRDRLSLMNECVRAYIGMRNSRRSITPGWLEQEVAATDALLSRMLEERTR